MFEIRLASSDEDLERLYRFRYSIYVEEMNRVQNDADHERKRIRDVLDDHAYNFLAYKNGEIIGSLRLNLTRDGQLPYYDEFYQIYDQPGVTTDNACIVTRLMVSNKIRKSSLAVRICVAAYEFALYRNIRYSFCDCNDHLVELFKSFGWEHYIGTAKHKEYGEVHPLKLDLHKEDYFRALESPFLKSFQFWNKQNCSDNDRYRPILEMYF